MRQLGSAHERLKMGWMSIEKETEGGVVVVHGRIGGAPPPPPPPLPAHPVSVPPIARTAIASAPGVRIVAPSWGAQPLAHGAGDGKIGGCPGNHGGCERSGGCERRARSSLLRRVFRHGSSVVAALAALAPRLVRLSHHGYSDRLLVTGRVTDVVPIYLALPPREIAYVKFVFESYEGVAVVRTLDRHAAHLVVLVAPDV